MKQEMKKIYLFSLSGVLNSLIGYALIFSLMLVGLSPLLSNILNYTVGFFLSFFLGKYLIFRSSNQKRLSELLKYLIVFGTAFLMNFLTLNFLLKFDLSPYLCQVCGGGVFSMINYLLSRLWVFRSIHG